MGESFASWAKWWLTLLLAALAGLVMTIVPARADHHANSLHLKPCILPAATGMSPAALLAAPARFDCSADQARRGAGDYWVSIQGFSAQGSAADPLVLRTASVWQHAVALHVRYADGATLALPPITSRETSRHLQLGAIIQYDLPLRAAPVTGVLARVEGAANVRGVLIAPVIQPVSVGTQGNLTLSALYAGFIGLCLALLCYNFALWAALRHGFQIAYCAMVLAIMAYAFSSSGALAWVFPAIDNNDRLRINYVTLTAGAVGALVFMRHFFEAGVIPGWLVRLMTFSSVFAGATTLLMVSFAPWQIALFDRLYTWGFLSLFACVPLIIWCAWARKSRFLTLFVLAWAPPVIGGLLRAAHVFGLIGYSFWLDNSTILAMAAEALLSSVAIAYRIRLITEERDQARAGESIARAEADTDALTGLLNRRAFLSAAIGTSQIQRLILIDIDHFKQVNDRIGHDGGDEVLRLFARIIESSAGADGIVARLGGEEFALLIPVDQARAIDPAKLLARIRAADLDFGLPVTASIGIAEGPVSCEDDWRALYRQADAALYRAKSDGRDRFCTITPLAKAA